MNEMVERVALALFWKAERLDPSDDGDVPEDEWRQGWPDKLHEHRRSFWRYLAEEAIRAAREPTEAMLENEEISRITISKAQAIHSSELPCAAIWSAMIDAALKE